MDSFSEQESSNEIVRFDDERVASPVICQSDMRRDFKRLVTNIADGVEKVEQDKLRYMTDTGPGQSALQILYDMEQKGIFSFNNVQPLEKLLQDIDRYDLLNLINTYKEKYGELATSGPSVQGNSKPMHTQRSDSIIKRSHPIEAVRGSPRHSAPASLYYHGHMSASLGAPRFATLPETETNEPRARRGMLTCGSYSSLPSGAMVVVHNSGNWTMTNGRYLTHTDPTKGNGAASMPKRYTESNSSSAENILGDLELSASTTMSQLTYGQEGRQDVDDQPELKSSASSAASRVSTSGDHHGQICKSHPKTEQSCCWTMKQSTLFSSLNQVGKVLQASKFNLPVGKWRWWFPSVTMKLLPKENPECRYFSLETQVVIPKSNSRRKWLVEYCQCTYVLSVKVFNPNTNEVVGEETKEVELAYSEINDCHTTTIKLSKLLHHNVVLYNNERTDKFQFHAVLLLIEHGYRGSDNSALKLSDPDDVDGYVDIQITPASQ